MASSGLSCRRATVPTTTAHDDDDARTSPAPSPQKPHTPTSLPPRRRIGPVKLLLRIVRKNPRFWPQKATRKRGFGSQKATIGQGLSVFGRLFHVVLADSLTILGGSFTGLAAYITLGRCIARYSSSNSVTAFTSSGASQVNGWWHALYAEDRVRMFMISADPGSSDNA
ncbi:hypothetical protein C8J57DRAFT_1719845 [Mycena rebaudengoi]|nr:hypothetical protein C8J57DRAFT_1719845 [Mycena rebaudengoi]